MPPADEHISELQHIAEHLDTDRLAQLVAEAEWLRDTQHHP